MDNQKRQPKDYKVASVSELSKKFSGSKTTVFVNYAGMTVKEQQELKKKLKESNTSMEVSKNTLIKIAASDAKFPEEVYSDRVLTGQTAIVIGTQDAVAPIQILGKYASEHESLKLKAGVVEGTFYDENGLQRLSKLPSKEVLYAQVVGAMSAPMYGIVGTLQGNIQKLLWILKAKASA